MLTVSECLVDLKNHSKEIIIKNRNVFNKIFKDFGTNSLELVDTQVLSLKYPILSLPKNTLSLNLSDYIEGKLLGIKGGYFILSSGYFNIKKHAGRQAILKIDDL